MLKKEFKNKQVCCYSNKILSIFAIFILLAGQVGFPLAVYAAPDLPSAPSAPSAPSTPEAPSVPDSPDSPDQPDEPDQPDVPEQTDESVQPDEPVITDETDQPSLDEEELDSDEAGDGDETPDEPQIENTSQSEGSYSGDNTIGDPKIETGDASAAGAIINTGNNNYAGDGNGYGSGGGSLSITNEGNGTDSNNSGSAVIDDTSTTTQGNIADVNNSLILSSSTGENSTSRNVGSSSIDTGDADVTGTIVNAINTNVDGLLVAEFNVADDQIGDLVLDFGAFCISGCGGDSVSIENTSNGSDSENDGSLTVTEENTTTQTNDATLTNDLTLSANSGDNTANDNTGGDSIIDTGDANVSGNVINFVNNNLAGNVIYGVVNIFGDLIGDIILPENYLAQLGLLYGTETDVSIGNSGNGTDSDNSGTVDLTQTNDFTQINDATILNNVILDGSTGGNIASDNTGGDNSIATGDVDIDATVVNIANTNIVGGTWWIVLVNEAGNWFGRILGAPDGSNYAGSSGTEFAINPNGSIDITNEGNGSGSDNTGTVTSDVTNTTTQTNNAVITNNIDLSANTGANSASRNTGGDSKINTGDANIMLNLVNFVNNNFAGGNVVFTVVNVFGSWLGDFVTPGSVKQTQVASSSNQNQQSGGSSESGGTQTNSENTNGNSQSGGNSSSGANANSGSSGTSSIPQGNISVSGQGSAASSYSSPATQIAGFSTSIETGENLDNAQISGDKSKKLRINLAWALLIVPLGGAAIFGIRKLSNRLA